MSVRISAHDWVDGGITPADAVEIARAFKAAGADMIDCSSGQVSAAQKPTYGRMYQTPFADRIRNEAGIATIAVGAISEADHVNSIIAAGRADLCAVARPHLANPAWTLMEAARIGCTAVAWPAPYRAAKGQMESLFARERRRWRPRLAAHAARGAEHRRGPSRSARAQPLRQLPALLGEDSIGVEARAPDGDHLALKLWLRLLACSTQIETEIRKRLRPLRHTLPRFDYLAQLERHPEGPAHERAVALPDGHRRQRHRPDRRAGRRRTAWSNACATRWTGDRRSCARDADRGRPRTLPSAWPAEHEAWLVELFGGSTPAPQQQALFETLGRLPVRTRQSPRCQDRSQGAALTP